MINIILIFGFMCGFSIKLAAKNNAHMMMPRKEALSRQDIVNNPVRP